MGKLFWSLFVVQSSDNLKSKTCAEPRRSIQNLKFGLLVVAVAVLVSSSVAQAQPGKKVPKIGYLSVRSAPSEREEAFKQGLRELGWVDGENISIEYRWAKEKPELLPELAADLVRLKVNLIVAPFTAAVEAAKKATPTIPIVMSPAADPVASKLIASLDRPGANITGLSLMGPELAGKRLELLREIVPRLNHVAFIAPGGDPAAALFVKEAQEAAQKLGLELQSFAVSNLGEIDSIFSTIKKRRVGALVIHPLFVSFPDQNRRIVELAVRHRLPSISDLTDFAEAGGLLSYGANIFALYHRAGYFVDKILKGAKPATLPVEQPRVFETVINLKTAKQIGLTIAPQILARADKVIK